MPEKFAFLDFDDTLCAGDSILPYLLYCVRRGVAPWTQVVIALLGYLRWRLRPAQASGAKRMTLSYIRGRSREEMDDLARDFFRERQSARFLPGAVRELWKLRQEGYKTVVVSASAEVYMRVLPEFLPVDAVLATRCPLDDAGRYTGEVGENCKGEEKPRRIRAWLKEQGVEADFPACRGYGDSPSDAPMLLMTGSAVLVDPKRALRERLPDAVCVHWHERGKRHADDSTIDHG